MGKRYDPVSLDDLPDLITPDMLAELTAQPGENLRAKATSIRRMCAEKSLPAVKIGTKWYMSRDVVLGDVMEPRRVSAKASAPDLIDALNEWMKSGTAILTRMKEEEVA